MGSYLWVLMLSAAETILNPIWRTYNEARTSQHSQCRLNGIERIMWNRTCLNYSVRCRRLRASLAAVPARRDGQQRVLHVPDRLLLPDGAAAGREHRREHRVRDREGVLHPPQRRLLSVLQLREHLRSLPSL